MTLLVTDGRRGEQESGILVGSRDAIVSKNCLYLSTSSTSRFLNETGGAFAGQWSEQENAHLAKITTKICCKEQSLWERGATFHCLFSSTICSSAFYLARKNTKVGKFSFHYQMGRWKAMAVQVIH